MSFDVNPRLFAIAVTSLFYGSALGDGFYPSGRATHAASPSAPATPVPLGTSRTSQAPSETPAERRAIDVVDAEYPGLGYRRAELRRLVRDLIADYRPGRTGFEDRVMAAYRAGELQAQARQAVADFRARKQAAAVQATRASRADEFDAAARYLHEQKGLPLPECKRLVVGAITRFLKERSEAAAGRR
jgi:hypothetical protein